MSRPRTVIHLGTVPEPGEDGESQYRQFKMMLIREIGIIPENCFMHKQSIDNGRFCVVLEVDKDHEEYGHKAKERHQEVWDGITKDEPTTLMRMSGYRITCRRPVI